MTLNRLHHVQNVPLFLLLSPLQVQLPNIKWIDNHRSVFKVQLSMVSAVYPQVRLYSHVHTYIHTYIHTYTYMHTDRQTDRHTCIDRQMDRLTNQSKLFIWLFSFTPRTPICSRLSTISMTSTLSWVRSRRRSSWSTPYNSWRRSHLNHW